MNEIERRYLTKKLPLNFHLLKGTEIEQGYLGATAEGRVFRLRRKGKRYYFTLKTGEGLKREEYEIELTAEQFSMLWPLTERCRVEKERFDLDHEGSRIETDLFKGRHMGLVISEVEFPAVKDAERFSAPDWFGPEITGDPRFSNFSLATRGIPVSELFDQVRIICQAAVMPFRVFNGYTQILLVKNRSRTKWVMPKGTVETGSNPEKTAEKEAFEEAGVRGRLSPGPLFCYAYNKSDAICPVTVYIMKVEEILDDWPESKTRKRNWFTLEETEIKLDERVPRTLFPLLKQYLDEELSCFL